MLSNKADLLVLAQRQWNEQQITWSDPAALTGYSLCKSLQAPAWFEMESNRTCWRFTDQTVNVGPPSMSCRCCAQSYCYNMSIFECRLTGLGLLNFSVQMKPQNGLHPLNWQDTVFTHVCTKCEEVNLIEGVVKANDSLLISVTRYNLHYLWARRLRPGQFPLERGMNMVEQPMEVNIDICWEWIKLNKYM